jgi:hypothetical protein
LNVITKTKIKMKNLKKQELKKINGGTDPNLICKQLCLKAYRRCTSDRDSCIAQYTECLADCEINPF